MGAGVGGTASAYYISQLFDLEDEDTIDIFEASDIIGGRIRTHDMADSRYEVGATIIHPDNFYMTNFTQMLGKAKRVEEINVEYHFFVNKQKIYFEWSIYLMY